MPADSRDAGPGDPSAEAKKRQGGSQGSSSARESCSMELAQLTHRAGQALGAVLYRLPQEHRQREAWRTARKSDTPAFHHDAAQSPLCNQVPMGERPAGGKPWRGQSSQ